MKNLLCLSPSLWGRLPFAVLSLLMAIIISFPCSAALVAYEGFNYTPGASLVGQNGGTSWANSWQAGSSGAGSGSTNVSSSLSYSDSLGNALVTSGNSALFSGAPAANQTAQPTRDINTLRSTGTTWISFLGIRQGLTTNTIPGNPYPRGANIALYNGNNQRLAIGNATSAPSNTWSVLPLGITGDAISSTNSFSQVSLVVIRIDHVGTTSDPDNAYMFVNPMLGVEPNTSTALVKSIAVNDYSFNRFRPFAGGYDVAGGQPNAQLRLDEIRVGDAYEDVTPYAGAPKISLNLTNLTIERCAGNLLAIAASGTQPLNYFWFFNSSQASATGPALPLDMAGPSQSGNYFVIVSNIAGVVTSAVATVSIVDTTPPSIIQCAPDQYIFADANCQGIMPSLTNSLQVSDCSGIASITQLPAAGTTLAAGRHTVTLSVTDSSNNLAQCASIVTIADRSPPVITQCAPTQHLNTAPNQLVGLPDLTGLIMISNHCNAAAIAQAPPTGTMLGPGDHLVTLTATTAQTNNDVCTTHVLVNGLPVASNQTAATGRDMPINLTLGGNDAEGGPISFFVVSPPSHGSLGMLNSNAVSYTPDANFVGADSLSFAVSDGTATSEVATVSITVTNIEILYPSGPRITKDGLTILLEDYASLPLSSRTTSTYPPPINFSDQLARVNFLRSEPSNAPASASRYFVCDNNRDLYILSKSSRSFAPYLNFEEIFPRFDNDPGYAGGLVTFAFDPEYATNGRFYTVHTEDPAKAASAIPVNTSLPSFNTTGYTVTSAVNPPVGSVSRQAVLVEWTDTNVSNGTFEGTAREILRVGFTSNIHPMGDLLFNPLAHPGDEDYRNLYVADGDGGAGESSSTRSIPQRLDAIQGKILRITPDLNLRPADELSPNGRYRIPTTGSNPNPFVNVSLANLRKEIFAYGFRNCHRISWDPVSNLIVEDDIGLHSWEEVNIIHRGANYGYSEREGTEQLFVGGTDNGQTGSQITPITPFPLPDTLNVTGLPDVVTPVYPVAAYSHEDGDAISSGFVYRGSLIPQLQGKYVFGEITTGRIFQCDLSAMIAADDGRRTSVAPIHELQVVFNSPTDTPDKGIVNRRPFDLISEMYFAKGGTSGQKLPGSAAATGGSDIDGVAYGRGRADIRLAMGGDGELFLLSKSDGMIRRLLAVPPPTITSVSLTNGTVTLSWQSIPMHKYRLQHTSALDAPAWNDVPGDIVASGQTAAKSNSPSGSAGFYRILLVQ